MRAIYNQNRYTINCDWLSYSVHLKESEPELVCPEGLRIELCQGNNIFEHRALVYASNGAKYLTLLWKPYSKVLPSNLMTVQLSNMYLYLAGQGILWSLQDVQEIVDCTFNGIGRLDICIDFEASEKRTAFLNHLNSGHYYAQHKSEGSSWWHDIGNNKKQLHCMSWGSKKSEIKVKLYHKSREQGLVGGDTPQKPWIVEEWKSNNMDIHNVWRLEFSLQGAGQLRYQGNPIKLENVADENWIVDVLCQLYHTRFVTRVNQGKRNGHHNNDDRIYLIPLPQRSARLKWAENQGKQYELPAAITLLRSLMRQIDNPAIMSSRPTFEDYATTVCNIIRDYHLEGYFRRTYDIDSQTYFENLYTNVGGGIRHTTPSPARLMD